MNEAKKVYYENTDSQFAKNNYIIELEKQNKEMLEYLIHLYKSQAVKSQKLTDLLNKYSEHK